jgi:hypothetical protein
MSSKNWGGGKGKGNKKLTHSYSPAEWRANEERKKVLDVHAKAKAERENKKGDKDVPNTGGERTAAADTTGNSEADSKEITVHAGNIAEI